MGAKFTPIQFDLIEEGRLKQSLDDEIAEATQKLLAHVKQYGPEVTKKSKAEVTLKVTVQFSGDEGEYSVKGALSTKLPGRPVHVTLAIQEEGDDGRDTLFVRASGSTKETPRQGRLATDDGRAVNPETGKAPPIEGKRVG